MIPDDHVLILFRFGEKRWMEKLVQGELSFSCTGAFINQAKRTANDIQGDKYEGVFARLTPDDKRISKMQTVLGCDLEEIIDGQYVLLRRRSSRLKPIFCFYGYIAGDALRDGKIKNSGPTTIRHDFDSRMFSGFSDSLRICNVISDSHRFTMIIIQPKPFVDRIKYAMFRDGIRYTMKRVNYEVFKSQTFFIEPTMSYYELFYKFPQYEYQHETRICLPNLNFSNIFERYPIKIGELLEGDYYLCHEELYFEFPAIIDKK